MNLVLGGKKPWKGSLRSSHSLSKLSVKHMQKSSGYSEALLITMGQNSLSVWGNSFTPPLNYQHSFSPLARREQDTWGGKKKKKKYNLHNSKKRRDLELRLAFFGTGKGGNDLVKIMTNTVQNVDQNDNMDLHGKILVYLLLISFCRFVH